MTDEQRVAANPSQIIEALASLGILGKPNGKSVLLDIEIGKTKLASVIFIVGPNIVIQTFLDIQCEDENISKLNMIMNIINYKSPFGTFQYGNNGLAHRCHIFTTDGRISVGLFREALDWIQHNINAFRSPLSAVAEGIADFSAVLEKINPSEANG